MISDDEIRFNEAFAREQWNRDHATPYDDEVGYPDHEEPMVMEYQQRPNYTKYDLIIEKYIIEEESSEVDYADGTEYLEIPLGRTAVWSLYKSLRKIVTKWEDVDADKGVIKDEGK